MIFKKSSILIIVLAIIVSISGCTKNAEVEMQGDQAGKIKVYTSFYAMYDFVKKIGGDKISLTNIVPSGTEPHDWEPTPKDIAGIQKADVLIYNGAGMEGWIDKVLKSSANKKTIVIEASKGIKLEGNSGKEEALQYDPHVWLNPMNAKKQMEIIKDGLAEADSENREYFEKNFFEYSNKLDELDGEYKRTVSSLKKKDVIVAHQAFGYLCNAYGLKQIAIEGLNADSEPTPAKMSSISKFAKENNVKTIFFEEMVSPKVAKAIAKEIGASTDKLNPLEGLTKEEIKAGKEYFSVMRDNLAAIKKALE